MQFLFYFFTKIYIVYTFISGESINVSSMCFFIYIYIYIYILILIQFVHFNLIIFIVVGKNWFRKISTKISSFF